MAQASDKFWVSGPFSSSWRSQLWIQSSGKTSLTKDGEGMIGAAGFCFCLATAKTMHGVLLSSVLLLKKFVDKNANLRASIDKNANLCASMGYKYQPPTHIEVGCAVARASVP